MREFNHTIRDELGMHARPSGMLMKEAKKYDNKITVVFGEKKADAKSVFGIMALGIKANDTFTLQIEGEDEDNLCEILKAYCEKNI